ncbi:MAG: Rpn family recombination-promoting nuclease/putative transposase [Lachnospiraceae bacterium]|nr:Rpn family recombination-promoting nuclease/putative transposase [Lachnospiraceae bacterium]
MQEKDITQKMLEHYNDVFADIVNVLLFNGERIVKENSLIDTPTVSSLKMDARIHHQNRDVSKYWQHNKINIAMLGFENQTSPNRLMPFRVISYDGAEYGRQANKKHADEGNYPVITLVLYFGYSQRWNYPKNILGLLNIDDRLKPFVSDYNINVFEIAFLDEEKRKLFKSDFRVLVDYLYQVRTNHNYNPEKYFVQHMQEVLDLMSAMTGDEVFEKSIENTKIKEAHYMCDVIHAMIDEGVERGRKEGREEGKLEGIQEGIQKGKLEGIQEGKLEGANIIIRLYEILLNEGSMDKLKRATNDEAYRYELLKEYDLLKDFS